jgi:hypothetical protein
VTRIRKAAKAEIADRIEGALDHVAALDVVPFSLKREAAEMAAELVFKFLRGDLSEDLQP